MCSHYHNVLIVLECFHHPLCSIAISPHSYPSSRRPLICFPPLCWSVAKSCPTLCDPVDCIAHQASLSFTISQSLLKFMGIESVILSNHLFFCHLLLLLPSIFPSIRIFSSELALRIRWPKYWCFSFSASNEYSGLISFRIDWFHLLAVQRTLKSLLQNYQFFSA